MATRNILVDDITGSLDNVETVSIVHNGRTITLDLCAEERQKIEDFLAPYHEHSRRVEAQKAKECAERRIRPETDPREVRAWAAQNGYTLSSRGRISEDVLDAYCEAVLGFVPVQPETPEAIRAWARAKGYEVSDRGRIANNILDEFRRDNAQGKA